MYADGGAQGQRAEAEVLWLARERERADMAGRDA